MSKSITIKHDGVDYKLEYSRYTAKMIEKAGFVRDSLFDSPNLMIPLLFKGAFKKNHPDLKEKVIDEILEGLENKDSFWNYLVSLYDDTLEGILTTTENSKNSTWEASW